MIGSLDHMGIAVPSLAEGTKKFVEGLGFTLHDTEEVPSENVRVAILFSGETRVELLEPTSDSSPISAFLSKRGSGVHHLAFRVDDVASEVKRLKTAGVKLIEPAPRPGAEGCKVAFIHPHATGGILIELVQRPQP